MLISDLVYAHSSVNVGGNYNFEFKDMKNYVDFQPFTVLLLTSVSGVNDVIGEAAFIYCGILFSIRKFCNGRWIYSFDKCIADLKSECPNVLPPTKQAINVPVKNFRETGSVENKEHVRRPTRLSDVVVEDIRQRILRSPRKSVRRLSRETGLSVGSCHTALRKSLNLYPYRLSSLHELTPVDFTKRLDYCR